MLKKYVFVGVSILILALAITFSDAQSKTTPTAPNVFDCPSKIKITITNPEGDTYVFEGALSGTPGSYPRRAALSGPPTAGGGITVISSTTAKIHFGVGLGYMSGINVYVTTQSLANGVQATMIGTGPTNNGRPESINTVVQLNPITNGHEATAAGTKVKIECV